jgi:hypothetical protein
MHRTKTGILQTKKIRGIEASSMGEKPYGGKIYTSLLVATHKP